MHREWMQVASAARAGVWNVTPATIGAAGRDVGRKLPLHPGHPERVCWGCAKYCPADDLACGNGTDRAQHPSEIFGDDWLSHGLDTDLPDVPEGPPPKAR